ncbi:hypothetical protein HFO16_17575 [Rhizobium laguerreae]|uniref:hypothetical protein n=1 Tax=Rhizobium laguerreae TaxID=1076926 RepID=UPI001C90D9DF|nr:hypothetical protein [Rhizobium laguerreae]MBY3243171.1 hypothetical protein [Rhizobium laguerreae]
MGSMSELMIERWAAEPVHVEVSFLCPICGHPSAAFLEFPGDEDDHIEEVSCLNPETDHEWTVRLRKKDESYSGQLEQHREVKVSVSMLDTSDDDWDEPLPEPGAYGIFLDAMREWRANVSAISEPSGASSRNRMLFGTLYSIGEAYFSDAIIGAALADTSVQRHLLKLDGLKDKQVSLETILDNPDIVREMVKTTLQGLSFHSLTLVNRICETAFGKPILPRDKDDRSLLMRSVNKRHDCVHRNGNDKDGNKHTDIDQDYLRKMGTLFEGMAQSLEDSMRDAKVKRFFDDLRPEDKRLCSGGA